MLPCSKNPLGRYGDEPEYKSLYATCLLEPESLGVKSSHDGPVEIVNQCSKQKEDGILCHERLWESVPAESVIHVIEYTLLAATQVNPLCGFSSSLQAIADANITLGLLRSSVVEFHDVSC